MVSKINHNHRRQIYGDSLQKIVHSPACTSSSGNVNELKYGKSDRVLVDSALLIILYSADLVTVSQGYIDVVTMFGKYRRILQPGLNFKIPLLEQIQKRISIQNRSVELEFQAVTTDQANVYFKSMLLYAVQNSDEETIKKVAFKFIAERDLMQALTTNH